MTESIMIPLLLILSVVSVYSKQDVVQPLDNNRWIVTEWSECSSSCGGVRVRSVHCVNKHGIASELCHAPKPNTHIPCNKDKCTRAGSDLSNYWERRRWLTHADRKETSTIDSVTQQTNFKSPTNQPQLPLMQMSTVPVDWTVSEWSECSATCGGGIRVRSVRCLDECGIISPRYLRCNTSKDSRPSTYEFCAQTDCNTGIMDDNILPPNGSIEFDIPDGSVSSLDFSSVSVERYQINQNITENDGTLTWLMEVVMDGMAQFSCEARSADMVISVGQSQGQNSIFLNGEFLFEVDCTVTTIVWLEEIVRYKNNTVTIQEQDIKFVNITTFWYCDGFRCYTFNSSKPLFERSGPTGKLFTSKDIALYSISSPINFDIEKKLENPPTISSPVITMNPTLTSTVPPNPTTRVISIALTSTPILTLETSIIALNSILPTPTPSNVISVPPSTSVFVSIASEVVTTLVSISPTPVRATISPTFSSMLFIPPISVEMTPTPTLDEVTPTQDVPKPCPRKTKFTKTKPYTKTSKPLSKLKTGLTKTGTKFTGSLTKTSRSKITDSFRTKYYTTRKYLDITKSESDTTKSSTIQCKTRDSKQGTRKTSRTMKRTDSSPTTRTKSRSPESKDKTFDKKTKTTISQSKTRLGSKTKATSPNKHEETTKRTSHSATRSKFDTSGTKIITEEILVLLIEVPFTNTHKNRYCSHLDESFKMEFSTVSRLEGLLTDYRKQFQILISDKDHHPPPHVHESDSTKKMLGKTSVNAQPSFDCKPEIDCTVNRKNTYLPLNQVFAICQHYLIDERHLFSCLYSEKILHCEIEDYSEKPKVLMKNDDFSMFLVICIDQVLLQQGRIKKNLYGKAFCCFEDDLDRGPT